MEAPPVAGRLISENRIVNSNPEVSNIASYDAFRKFLNELVRLVGRAIRGVRTERLRATKRAGGVENDHLCGQSAVPKWSDVRDVRVRAELMDFQVHKRLLWVAGES